jgi:hypothetical protein
MFKPGFSLKWGGTQREIDHCYWWLEGGIMNQQSSNDIQFHAWPKIGRLNRDIIITEKLDGTNAAIGITADGRVYAQSRTRIITSQDDNAGFARWVEKHADLLREHLGEGLHFGEWWGVSIGRGYDLSERRFSLFNTKRWHSEVAGLMALAALRDKGAAVYTVPVLYEGPWTGVFGYKNEAGEWHSTTEPHDPEWPAIMGQENPRPRFAPNFILEWLARVGSQAAPGFARPEGIVIYHRAGDTLFKVTIDKDEQWKGAQA